MWRIIAIPCAVIYLIIIAISCLFSLFNGGGFLATAVAFVILFIPALIIFLLMDVLEEIDVVKSICYRIERTNYDEEKPKNYSNGFSSLFSATANENAKFWTCSKCGAENIINNIHCDNCGNHK